MFPELESFLLVNPKKIIEELTGSWSPTQYNGKNSEPRKDFVPFSKTDSSNYSKQSGIELPNNNEPYSPSSMPYPLGHVVDDLSDSYIYLRSSLKKIAECCKNNKSLSEKQIRKLSKLYIHGKKAMNTIYQIGKHIEDVASISGQPSQTIPSKPIELP